MSDSRRLIAAVPHATDAFASDTLNACAAFHLPRSVQVTSAAFSGLSRAFIALWLFAVSPFLALAAPPATQSPDTKASILQPSYLGKEIMIARDTEEGTVMNVRWCGPGALAYQFSYSEFTKSPLKSHGIYWVDFVKNRRQAVELGKNSGLGQCSPDGKWVIYSVWGDESLWGYNVETRKKAKLLAGTAYPPAGKRYLMRYKSADPTPMSTPQVEIVPLLKDYSHNGFEAAWFPDNKRVLVKYQNDKVDVRSRYLLGLETHDNGKHEFKPLKSEHELGQIKIDSANRIYAFIEKMLPSPKGLKTSRKLARCEVVGDNMKCQELFPGNERIFPYDISRNGNTLVFREEGNPCLWVYVVKSDKKECIAKSYINPMFWISPDGKWLAFDYYEKYHPSQVTYLMGHKLIAIKLSDN